VGRAAANHVKAAVKDRVEQLGSDNNHPLELGRVGNLKPDQQVHPLIFCLFVHNLNPAVIAGHSTKRAQRAMKSGHLPWHASNSFQCHSVMIVPVGPLGYDTTRSGILRLPSGSASF
jgi:hypothetical protein